MWDKDKFKNIAGFEPNPMQEEVGKIIANGDIGLLLKAPTGSGKTEAILIPSVLADKRLFLILPAKSLVEDHLIRTKKILEKLSKKENRRYSLIMDTGAHSFLLVFENGNQVSKKERHLYYGNVIITTLDKFIYRFFGFGDKRKSYTFPLRTLYGIGRPIFCFDEAHTYEGIAFVNFSKLVRTIYEKGLDVVVMTATMPKNFEDGYLDFLEKIDYLGDKVKRESLENFFINCVDRRNPEKFLEFVEIDNNSIVPNIVEKAKEISEAQNCKLIIALNKVEDCAKVYDELKLSFGDKVLIYHGRIPDTRRQEIYQNIKDKDEKGKPYIMVTTSALEVGCDLSAKVLITQICPPDSLIQKSGRCNRKGEFQNAKVIVVGRDIDKFLNYLSHEATGKYIRVLKEMNGKPLDTQKIAEQIDKPTYYDNRAETLFDMLYEYVYEAKLENKHLYDKGFIITRSWEPSVTITSDLKDTNKAITVNVETLLYGEESDEVEIYERRYDPEDAKWKLELIQFGGCLYHREVIIKLPDKFFDPDKGYTKLPKVFRILNWNSGYKRLIQSIKSNKKDKPEGVVFVDDQEKKGVIFWYLVPEIQLREENKEE